MSIQIKTPIVLTSDGLKKMFPKAVPGKSVTLPGEYIKVFLNLLKAKNEVANLESEIEACENQLKYAIGDAEIGILGEQKLKWGNVSKESLDTKALKTAHPEITEQFMRTTEYRMFKV